MSKPADATPDDVFEKLAALVEESIVSLFVADASDRRRALRFNIRDPLVGGWPAIL
jgi:hypothetical protein